ncbi:Nucleoporin POM33 [Ceratocystis fimbriata CBS 114723]|uniref:Nucleoporin POM33 n=1 Tax=Ceratocystis fimbriata CBS 114723 TaxID=1035309 RepID=A0A2C5WUQ6_9PEZI|nr:Nucleoporin POM33 [Ceratocystis fimbriata CBS 114723]
MAPPASAQKPLAERFQELAKTLQFAWFSGHVMLIFSTLLYMFQFIKFNTSGGFARFTYRVGFLSAILTYGIVVYKSFMARQKLGSRAPSGIMTIVGDENVQYMVMSVVWFLMPHFTLALLPYFVYSVFHVATYLRTNILPTIYPPTITTSSDSTPGSKVQHNPAAERYISMLRSFVNSHYDASMALVARFEIALWVELAFYALFFRRWSWVLITVYTAFVRVRYSQSMHLQTLFTSLSTQIDSKMAYQGTPPGVRQGWETAKSVTKQFYAATDINKYIGGAPAPKKSS